MENLEHVVTESARAKWTRIIEQQRSSGLAVSVFCGQRSLAVSSYYAWRRKLEPEPTAAGFVEATVVRERGGEAIVGGLGAGTSLGVGIELAGGRRVVVSRGFDRRLLLDVIATLEEMSAMAGEAR